MTIEYRYLIPLMMWTGWALYWVALSFNVRVAARRESLPSRLVHVGLLAVAVLLLWGPRVSLPILGESFLSTVAWPFWIGSTLTAAGLLFAVWARSYLGQNWSSTVTIKEGHEFVTGGPYALVRHPIYLGFLIAFVGSALALSEWRDMLAVAIAFWAFWRKLRLEERCMRQQFGETYQTYCRRVAALLPFVL
jgi:protein-S-isoprenylcysteine O-methyltransferase Ste14